MNKLNQKYNSDGEVKQIESNEQDSDRAAQRENKDIELKMKLQEVEEEMKEEKVQRERKEDETESSCLSGAALREAQEKKAEDRRVRKELQLMRLKRSDYSDNIIQELNCENLSNFYERCQRELTDFWDLFQYEKKIEDELLDPNSDSPYRTLFLETLYSFRISVENAVTYQEYLLKRIDAIEFMIDKYFNLLIPTFIEKLRYSFDRDRARRKKDNKEGLIKDQVAQRKYEEWFFKYSKEVQFENKEIYTYKKKMKLLVEYRDELIIADKNRKENKLGVQDICRMTGSLSQSYFIFDAYQYSVGRKIYYGIDKEVAEEVNNEDMVEESSRSSSSEYSSSSDSSLESKIKSRKKKIRISVVSKTNKSKSSHKKSRIGSQKKVAPK